MKKFLKVKFFCLFFKEIYKKFTLHIFQKFFQHFFHQIPILKLIRVQAIIIHKNGFCLGFIRKTIFRNFFNQIIFFYKKFSRRKNYKNFSSSKNSPIAKHFFGRQGWMIKHNIKKKIFKQFRNF